MMARSTGIELWEVHTMAIESTHSFDSKYIGNIMISSREVQKYKSKKYMYSHQEVQMFTFGSAKSSIICKTNHDIIRKNERKYNNDK
jgi:hypothetical protein